MKKQHQHKTRSPQTKEQQCKKLTLRPTGVNLQNISLLMYGALYKRNLKMIYYIKIDLKRKKQSLDIL